MPMLIGGAAGALFNRKNPLKGALLGGGLGAAGGLLSGGGLASLPKNLFGAVPDIAAGANPVSALAGNTAAVTSALGNPMGAATPGFSGVAAEQAAAPIVDMSTSAGLFDKANFATNGWLDKGMQAAKPVGQAMQVANSMRPEEQPMMPSPLPSPPPASPAFSGVVQNRNNIAMNRADEAMKRKQRRYSLLG
jgi:hypothetical protein